MTAQPHLLFMGYQKSPNDNLHCDTCSVKFKMLCFTPYGVQASDVHHRQIQSKSIATSKWCNILLAVPNQVLSTTLILERNSALWVHEYGTLPYYTDLPSRVANHYA